MERDNLRFSPHEEIRGHEVGQKPTQKDASPSRRGGFSDERSKAIQGPSAQKSHSTGNAGKETNMNEVDYLGRCVRCGREIATGGCPFCDAIKVICGLCGQRINPAPGEHLCPNVTILKTSEDPR
jgi:hypothetical protein